MNNPISTYRIQFHKEFSFQQMEAVIPYLRQLGIHTLYASPIYAAIPGSTHGYDGVDPESINPEIGSMDDFLHLREQLRQAGIQWLQDIVPNHMALHERNRWLWDYLEKGELSLYANYFDVDTQSPLYQGRLMIPTLGGNAEDLIGDGTIRIAFREGGLGLECYGTFYPLHTGSYQQILEPMHNTAVNALLKTLSKTSDRYTFANHTAELKAMLKGRDTEIIPYVNAINEDPELVSAIFEAQHYRLCHWQETDKQINYRRFFTVNNLICLNIQHPEVFSHYHALTEKLITEGHFQGLRIDHVDGLYDPATYLDNLRAISGEDCYTVVEKILEPGEILPDEWAVQGTTGYSFLGMVNNLLTNGSNEGRFTALYQQITQDTTPIPEQIRQKKSYILREHMGGELHNLHQLFLSLPVADQPDDQLQEAIASILVNCPVYRYYGNSLPLPADEASAFRHILDTVKNLHPQLTAAVSQIEVALLIKPAVGDEAYNKAALHCYQRLMQFTGPLMAKGVEDTLMYTYARFVGHNEVGDMPSSFGLSAAQFHAAMQHRRQHGAMAMNGTATHDTKRGEDVRARLNVLTDLPDKWEAFVQQWLAAHTEQQPDNNDKYFIYQNIVGAYPYRPDEQAAFADRLKAYLQKAWREAKRHSQWTSPNEAYEQATSQFVDQLLDPAGAFHTSLQLLLNDIADFGIINSLAQLALKCTCPGIPDIYQGTELWDFSFVDPDNRRPVDYTLRNTMLSELEEQQQQPDFLRSLWEDRNSGRIKLWLLHQLLELRKEKALLFEKGHYLPLETTGSYKEHLFAYARRYKEDWVIVAVPIGLAAICPKGELTSFDWQDTAIILPEASPDHWVSSLTSQQGVAPYNIYAHELFREAPIAILTLSQPSNHRKAGILMAITSLPSPYGVGDLGETAYEFADFLARSNQKLWQVLPLNYTDASSGYSPYSATSAMAGLPLLIDLQQLADKGWLDTEELKALQQPITSKTDYANAQLIKDKMLQKAFEAFTASRPNKAQQAFEQYCAAEADWLDDFAIFRVLKNTHEDKAWHHWPAEYKERHPQALASFAQEHSTAIEKEKWLQYIFSQQWQRLREYCTSLDIAMFGDLPIYIAADSVDVWANRSIFSINEAGEVTGMAGVPPDYFSADGQLWGMPTFKWDVLAQTGYDWWIQRLRKNFQLYDLLRLDHFRAFYDYWEVPAGETTARNGSWKAGPGIAFFNTVKEQLGDIPFVAEDLGDIAHGVYELRDALEMPGMHVLQFAFGGDLPTAVHTPHNYTINSVAYTGTHDNNTTLGWYLTDASHDDKERADRYFGYSLNPQNVTDAMVRMVYASVAQIAIIPMQDVLGQDQYYRMNVPSSTAGNWSYRLETGLITKNTEEKLRKWIKFFNRA